jgi:1-acyl-sn-glycerol-3-phosphate acyltransferase
MDAQGSTHELPRTSRRLHGWFVLYLERYLARHFSGVRCARSGMPPVAEDGPLVVYSNHPSWWDPLVFLLLARRFFPEREGYGPMDAAALERYGVFRRLGVFGVEQGSARGTRAFLRTSAGVLERPRSTLWLTAQGELVDPRARPVRLRPGLAHLVRRLRGATVVPLALEYPFWNERLPEVLVRFGTPIAVGDGDAATAGEWNELFAERLAATMDELAADSAGRSPGPFESLLEGRVGVGGVYERWRRARALLAGKSFEAAHDPSRRERPRALAAGTAPK